MKEKNENMQYKMLQYSYERYNIILLEFWLIDKSTSNLFNKLIFNSIIITIMIILI